MVSPSHIRTNITCLHIFNESNVFSWNIPPEYRIQPTNQLQNCPSPRPSRTWKCQARTYSICHGAMVGRESHDTDINRPCSCRGMYQPHPARQEQWGMHHIWNSFKLSTPFCTTLKPKCRTEILVAGKGIRQRKPQGQLRTISPWGAWYNSLYNTRPLKINSIKLLYSYVDSFHAVAASPYCTSVSTYKHKHIRSKLRTRKLDFLGKGTGWHNTLYKLSYLLLVNYMVQSPHLSWR